MEGWHKRFHFVGLRYGLATKTRLTSKVKPSIFSFPRVGITRTFYHAHCDLISTVTPPVLPHLPFERYLQKKFLINHLLDHSLLYLLRIVVM